MVMWKITAPGRSMIAIIIPCIPPTNLGWNFYIFVPDDEYAQINHNDRGGVKLQSALLVQ